MIACDDGSLGRMMQEEDSRWSALMAAAQDGDRRSYETLLREIVPVLKRFIRARWSWAGSSEIDDVVQETLISLHAARHTHMRGRPFLPWILAIARFRLLDAQRSQIRRRRLEAEIGAGDETISAVPSNTPMDGIAAAAELQRAMTGLPPAQRKAIELLKLKEMTLKEAAAASGMSIAALKVASHRAVKALRIILGRGP